MGSKLSKNDYLCVFKSHRRPTFHRTPRHDEGAALLREQPDGAGGPEWGCTIVITGENGLQYIWKDDKLYCKIGRANVEVNPNRAGKYVGSVLETLNKINGTKEGMIVLGHKTQYTISNKQKGNTDACFSHSDNTLYLPMWVRSVSHFRRDLQANASKAYKNYEYVPKGFGCGNSLLKKIR